jgi:hypothetical protein
MRQIAPELSLSADVPGAPHTETLIFATGRGAVPSVHVTMDVMRDIAIRVLRDGAFMDPDTVEGLCRAFLELDAKLAHTSLQLLQVRDNSRVCAIDLKAARESAIQSEVLRVSALDDALQQRTLAIQLSEENRALRLEACAYLDLQVCIDPLDNDRQPELYQGGQWDGGDDTMVQESPYGCFPTRNQ